MTAVWSDCEWKLAHSPIWGLATGFEIAAIPPTATIIRHVIIRDGEGGVNCGSVVSTRVAQRRPRYGRFPAASEGLMAGLSGRRGIRVAWTA